MAVSISVYRHTLYLATRGCNKQQNFMCLLMTNLDGRHFLIAPSGRGQMQPEPKHCHLLEYLDFKLPSGATKEGVNRHRSAYILLHLSPVQRWDDLWGGNC